MSVEQINAWRDLIVLGLIPLVTAVVGFLTWKGNRDSAERDRQAAVSRNIALAQNQTIIQKADDAVATAKDTAKVLAEKTEQVAARLEEKTDLQTLEIKTAVNGPLTASLDATATALQGKADATKKDSDYAAADVARVISEQHKKTVGETSIFKK